MLWAGRKCVGRFQVISQRVTPVEQTAQR